MRSGKFLYARIDIPDGIRIISSEGMKTTRHKSIKFRLLTYRKINARQYGKFASIFLQKILLPLIEYHQMDARGKFKGRGSTLFWIKRDATELYHLLKYLSDTGKEPYYYATLLKKFTHPDYRRLIVDNENNPDPLALTVCCMELYLKKINKSSKQLGVESFYSRLNKEGLRYFKAQYIRKPLIDVKKMSDPEIESIVKSPPFSYIFSSLNII